MSKPLALLLTLAFALAAQQEPIRVDVPVVFVPVTVTDSHGRYLNNLDAPDFELADNGKPVPFSLTTSDSLSAPLALAVLVQANEPAVTAIEKIRKVGSVIHALVAGQRGSVMLMAYGEEIKTIQPWTRDPDSLSASFKSLRPQWTAKARMLDAVTAAVDELARRAPEERRVLLVIGETKDRGSKTGVLAAIEAASRAGVIIHGVTFSAYATAFTRKGETTPTTTGGFNIAGIFSEIGRLGKENTMEMLAYTSGGRRRGFTTLHGLEEELAHTGEEIHSQYLLSFTPQNPTPGFHSLTVRIKNPKDTQVRTRTGYWAGDPQPATP